MKNIFTLLFALTLCCYGIESLAQISFTFNPSTGCTPLDVTFLNTSTDPQAYRYEWNFGDGPVVIDTQTTTINHLYINRGTYSIYLYVYDISGSYRGGYTSTIAVNGLSSWDQINLWPENACPGENVSVNAPWGFPSYVFDYGDGVIETSTGNYRNHIYNSAGTYIISVYIPDVCAGNDTTLYDTITLSTTKYFPSWAYYYHPQQSCPNNNVGFNAEYGQAQYIWNFGDGTVDTTLSNNTNHTYNTIGTYSPTVTLINFCGDDTTLSMVSGSYNTIDIRYSPFPYMTLGTYFSPSGNPGMGCPGEQVSFNAPYGYVYYVWNYGDGSPVDSGNSAYKNHIYANTGTYTASVKLHQTCGNDTTISATVIMGTYNPFPNWISLYDYPDPACPYQPINFNGPWGYPSYQWTWGDGTPVQTTTNPYTSHQYVSGGTKNVSLKVTNLCGNDTTIGTSVTINPNLPFPAGTSFSAGNNFTSCPGKVNFSATYGYQYYTWNFGDGNTETTLNYYVTHTYTTLGDYSVSVKLMDYCGKDTTLYDTLRIAYTPFTAGMQINVYDDNSCPGENIQFSAPWGYVSYQWNFGDGNTLTGSNYVNYSYSAVGQYIITVKIRQLCGNDTTLSKLVKVINNQSFPNWINLYLNPSPPIPTKVCPGQPVDFYGPWDYASYIWYFGDGETDTTASPNNTHLYYTAGSYPCSVKVFNYCGLDTTLLNTVVVDTSISISAGVSAGYWIPNGTSACPGEFINFYVNGPIAYPYYEWDFGDGTTPISGSINFINHSYSEPGEYIVAVSVSNECGSDTTLYMTLNITGNKYIGAALMINKNPSWNICPGAPVNFSGPTGFASYIWTFGDGSQPDSTTSNFVTHSFNSPGTFNVSMKVINYCGNDTISTTQITIDNTVTSWTSINPYPNPICPGQTVNLAADTGFISYFWDFDDGTSGYGSNKVNHVFNSLGDYTVSVVITNYCYNSDTFSTTVTVDNNTSFPSWMNMWSNSWAVCPGDVTTLNTQPGFNSYFWDFGDDDTITTTGSSIGHVYNDAGNYTATVTINNGCGNTTSLSTTVNISASSSVNTPNIFTPLSAYCPGDAVMFLLNDYGQGYAQNYIYFWDFGDGNADTTFGFGATHVYDSVGSYTTIVTIENSCGNSAMTIVPVNIKGSTTPTLNSTMWGTLAHTGIVGCPGDAVVFYFKGTGNNIWDFGDGSTGIATEEFVNEKGVMMTVIKHAYGTAGTYTLALTLTNGCGNSVTDSLTIQIINNLMVDGGLIVEPPMGTSSYSTCRELNFIAFGGSSYEWDFGDGGSLITISPTTSHIYSTPGNYAVGVLITNECGYSTYFSKAINVTQSGGASIDLVTVTDATCFGGNDGTATVTVSGGETPYSYLWSDESAQTGVTATGLKAGDYLVTVSDALGCESEEYISVSEADEISLSTSSANSSCGGSSGSASVSIISGGNLPFNYSWTGGSTTSNATGLSSGTFTVTVTDATGCTSVTMAAVSDNGGPTITLNSITNVACNGNSTGSVAITASGLNTPFTYLWSNGSTTDDISGLKAGSYALTISDTAGCNTVAVIDVTEPDKLEVSFSATGAECGEATGTATVSVSGGVPSYGYLWDSNAGSKITATVTGLSANAYRVTVTDGNSCTTVGIVTINNTNAPSLSVSKTNVSCPGLSDGAIDATVTQGTTPYVYIWTWSGGGSSVQDLSGLDAGVYTLMVQDASNCWIGTSVTITEPSITLTTSVTNVSCVGGSTGSASATVSGGETPYAYLWSTSGTGSSVTGLAAGTYTVTVTDGNSCTVTASPTVTEPSAITVTLSNTNVSCYGGSNGTATATVSGGSSPYIYAWSTGSTSSTASVLNAATYTVTVTDACSATGSGSATVTQPTQITATMSKTNVSCYGGGDGTATVSVSGGTSPYNYSWNNGQTTSSAYGLFPGLQAVNVFDANGCLKSNNVTITQPAQLSATASVSYVSCFAGSDGGVDITVSGGTSPYTFIWSNSAISEDVTGLTAGTYTVTITDSCSATVTASGTLTQPGALSLSLVKTNVTCNSVNNGSVNLTASGGVTPYTYLWSNNATSEDVSNLAPATYTVTVTDVCGQTATGTAVITEPAAVSVTISGSNVTCYGLGNGSATATAAGGTVPYIYQWNNSQNTQTAIGLFAGFYSVNVFDANSCLASNSITITQPVQLTAAATTTAIATCGNFDGGTAVTVSGGTTPYSYNWNTGGTGSTETSIAGGSYSVTVTDSKSCSAASSVTVPVEAVTQQICIVTVDEVVKKNEIAWEKSGGLSTLGYVIYKEIMTNVYDSIGFVPYDSLSTYIDYSSDPKTKSAKYKVTTADSCGNESTPGTAHKTMHLTVSTGIIPPPYTERNLVWENYEGFTAPQYRIWRGIALNNIVLIDSVVSTTTTYSDYDTLAGADSLFYIVELVHPTGCTSTLKLKSYNSSKSNTASMEAPSLPMTLTTTSTDVSCNNGSDGNITANPNGGDPAYSYLWSNAQTGQTATGLFAGIYTVTVTDSQGSTVTGTASVTQPSAISIAATSTGATCNNPDGSASATATGGNGGFGYNWSDGQTTQTAAGLTAGNYAVTATDSKGCTSVTTTTVTTANIAVTISTSTSDVTCNGGNDGNATATPTSGTAPYIYLWNNGASTDTLQGVSAGAYSVTVTDAGGCFGSQNATVSEPAAISISVTSTNSTCGNADGAATASSTGGNGGFGYLWNDPLSQTTSTATGLSAGNYTVSATDSKGCVQTAIASVSDLNAPLLSMTSTQVTCNGDADGTATVTITDGTPPYSVQWDSSAGNQTTTTVTGLSGGNYSVIVTDSAGCIATQNTLVTEPAALSLTAVITNANSPGNNDGTINISVTGGTGAYTYQWSTGAVTEDVISLPTDTYAVTVTDANNCQLVVDTFNVKLITPVGKYEPVSGIKAYPNPFNRQTTIEYSLAAESEVAIELFNLVTQKNTLLYDEISAPGRHEITINGDRYGLPGGIYLVRFTVNGSVRNMRLVKVK
ncbi:MAG: PKD domain-containing protein [Bacteroidetes bacterium]|nr:PKD domain-containing protein [Bacteroidota bacterium]